MSRLMSMDAPYEHKKVIKKKIRTLGKQYLKKNAS